MPDRLKEKAVDFVKMFGAELALEFYHDNLVSGLGDFLNQYTTESFTRLVNNSEMIAVPQNFYDFIGEYKAIIQGYDTEQFAKILFELFNDARPDLASVLISLNEVGADWLFKCSKMMHDRIVSPEQYIEEMEKSLLVLVTCDECKESFRVPRDKADKLTVCPFCGKGGSKPKVEESAEEPPSDQVA